MVYMLQGDPFDHTYAPAQRQRFHAMLRHLPFAAEAEQEQRGTQGEDGVRQFSLQGPSHYGMLSDLYAVSDREGCPLACMESFLCDVHATIFGADEGAGAESCPALLGSYMYSSFYASGRLVRSRGRGIFERALSLVSSASAMRTPTAEGAGGRIQNSAGKL